MAEIGLQRSGIRGSLGAITTKQYGWRAMLFVNAATSSALTEYLPLLPQWPVRSVLPNLLCRRCGAPSPIFLLAGLRTICPGYDDE